MPLSIVILAACQGKRMASDLPKVLQPLAGRPLLAHVIDTARLLNPAAIHVIYGHGGERVREAFLDAGIRWTLRLGLPHQASLVEKASGEPRQRGRLTNTRSGYNGCSKSGEILGKVRIWQVTATDGAALSARACRFQCRLSASIAFRGY